MGATEGDGEASTAAVRVRWRPSVVAALFVAFGGLVFVAASASFLVAALVAERNTRELVTDAAELYLENMELRIEAIVAPARRQVEFVSAHLALGRTPLDDDQRIADLLTGTLAGGAEIAGIAFVKPDLTAIRAGQWLGDHGVGVEEFVTWPEMRLLIRQGEKSHELYWSDPIYMDFFDTSFLVVMHPVRRGDEFLGIVAAAVSLPSLSNSIQMEVAEQPGLVAFALRGPDHVIAHPILAAGLVEHSSELPVPTRDTLSDPVLAALWEAERYPIELIDAPDIQAWELYVGTEEYVVIMKEVAEYGDIPLSIGVHFPRAQAGGYVERLELAVYVGIAIVLAAILVAWLIGRAIARPIRRLASNADRIAALDFEHAEFLPASPLLETDQARMAFNSMLTGLRWLELYIPRRLVERLIAQRGAASLPSEQREVTVLFTDIAGFTAIGERLSAERLSAFLNRHFSMLASFIEAEGGTIDKYIGDSIMAFWNAPDDQPDHADRALRAARAIAQRLKADNARRAGKGLRPVRLRVGLHTGPAIAGNIGAPGRINYTLVGDTVNAAQRLEALGKELQPDAEVSIIASETVLAGAKAPGPHRALGTVALRGRGEPLSVFGIDSA